MPLNLETDMATSESFVRLKAIVNPNKCNNPCINTRMISIVFMTSHFDIVNEQLNGQGGDDGCI
jgi:hypothetical protein